MAELFSKPLFRRYIDEFANHSQILKRQKLTIEAIAKKVFPGASNAKRRMHEAYTVGSGRPLDAVVLGDTLGVCRELLIEQLKALQVPNPQDSLKRFEAGICRKLKLSPGGATTEDFQLDRRAATCLQAEDFGMPNIIDWRDDGFEFVDELEVTQRRSIDVLQTVVDYIDRETDPERRLALLHTALSIAYLNHPGTRWHSRACNLAFEAAGKAQLPLLAMGEHIPDHLQQPAARLTTYLYWAPFFPELNSPTNYLRYALRGKRMPPAIWRRTQPFLEEAILAANRYAEMRPNEELAIIGRSGIVSMKARFLAVGGGTGSLREADQLQRESLLGIDRLSVPYGFAYPVLKDIVSGKIKSAIRRCERIVDAYDRVHYQTSAAAFAALLVHLTTLYGGSPTTDQRLLELASDALASPAVRYKCSHIFDAHAVARILWDPKRRPTVT